MGNATLIDPSILVAIGEDKGTLETSEELSVFSEEENVEEYDEERE